MPASAPQLSWPLVTSATASNPFCYTEETTFGVLKTASPAYSAVAVAQDITWRQDNPLTKVPIAGSHYPYQQGVTGHNYTLTVPFHPLDLTFLKYGTEAPNYTTPAGTSAASLQFLYKGKQALGTAQLYDAYTFFLGFRPNTTSLSVSAQGLVEASMELIGREVYTVTTLNGGMTTPSIPTFASVTGSVFSDGDSTSKPITIDGATYTGDNWTIQWSNGTFAKPYLGGGGYNETVLIGGIDITGSFTTPVGESAALETIAANPSQPGVTAKYVIKTGALVLNMTKFVITGVDQSILGQPTSPLEKTYNFACATAGVATS